MKKKLLITVAIILLLITGGYIFLRFGFLKSKDFKPDISKEKSVIDLRPAIIAKLQQSVKDASNGLYILSVEKIEPHLLTSKLDMFNASISIDTAAMIRLNSLELLPDDIFTFHFSALHIDGIGIEDMVNRNRIEIKEIHISQPAIDVYHHKRKYNSAGRKRKDTLSLYEKLKGNFNMIGIGKINIAKGRFINHDIVKQKVRKFNDVSVVINDLLIDSSTINDKSRFLFTKQMVFETKNYSIATADSLYFFKAGNISLSASQHSITVLNAELKPRYNRQQFKNKLRFAKDMYHLILPKITLTDVNWQQLIGNEKFVCKQADIPEGKFTIYFDRSQPQPPLKLNNFPPQALMALPFPVSINKINIRHLNFSYEEYNPLSDKNGKIYFDELAIQINNVTNIIAEIKSKPLLNVSASASFMHHVPFSAKFNFNLAKYRTGNFTSVINIGLLNDTTINTIAEPLGLFSVKSGQMQKAVIKVEGDNYNTKGKITMYYTDLKITPLKKDVVGRLKKKTFTGILANTLLIKNDNPKGKELREPEFTVTRTTHKNFFNFLWKSILTGVVKTVGIPEKFAESKN